MNRFSMIVAASSFALMPSQAWAAKYIYTGNNYTEISGTIFNTDDYVSLSFETDVPLQKYDSYFDIKPLIKNFEFSNGFYTLSSEGFSAAFNYMPFFTVKTNEKGEIIEWSTRINTGSREILTFSAGGNAIDLGTQSRSCGFRGTCRDRGQVTNNPGVWSYEFPAAAVPEPSAWLMLLLGFGFVGAAMRASKRSQRISVSYA